MRTAEGFSMTYTITKVETRGNKFGEKGDAEVSIHFKLPNVPEENQRFALMLLRDEDGNTPVGISYDIQRQDKGIIMTQDCLTYRPRFSFADTDPSTWKMKTLNDLLEIIRDYSEKMESVVARTTTPVMVEKLINNPNLSSHSLEWIPQRKVWCIHLALRQPSEWEANKAWPTLLDRTYYDPTRRIEVERDLEFTEEELSQLNIEWLNSVITEMAAEVNEEAMRNVAMNKLTEKLKTKELQCTDIRYMSLNVHELEIWSSHVEDKRKMTWLNTTDLLSQVEALNVEQLADEMHQNIALAKQEVLRLVKLTAERDERQAKRMAEKEAKEKLAASWAEIQRRAHEMRLKVSQ